MASMSEVSREMTRPEVYFSWKLSDSRWKWSNTRRRSSSRMSWPIRPDMVRNACRVSAWVTAAARMTPTTVSRVPGPVPRSIGGMPSSMPTLTR